MIDKLYHSLRGIITEQRPIFWPIKTLGKCDLEREERPMLKADWHAQQWAMLQALNNIRWAHDNQPPLEPEERNRIYDLLMQKGKVTFAAIHKALSSRGKHFTFENKDDKRKDLPGNATEAILREVLGKHFPEHPQCALIREEIAQKIWEVDYRKVKDRVEICDFDDIEKNKKKFIKYAVTTWNISGKEAEEILKKKEGLPGGWLSFSKKAVQAMLPRMEKGEGMTAVKDDIYKPENRLRGENKSKLPSHPKYLLDIRNPVVSRSLNEIRKTVNNLIHRYGKPDTIRIELARDVKLVGKQKQRALKINRERKKARDGAIKYLNENSIHISGDNIKKHMLWEECNHICPYTGKTICCDDLFRKGKFQIEHIIPLWYSRNDSWNNLSLCEASLNRKKGNQTPFEAFGQSSDWDKMKERIRDHVKAKRMSQTKLKRFTRETYRKDDKADEHSGSHLPDTAYAAKRMRDFLAVLYPKGEAIDWSKSRPPHIQTTKGIATSFTAKKWGLYRHISEDNKKTRQDHRHHALDALAIAAITPGQIKRVMEQIRAGRKKGQSWQEIKDGFKIRPPWRDFHKQANEAMEKMLVSHRVEKKISGALHEDTHLAWIGEDPEDKSYHRYVKRVPLKEITKNQIDDIRDERIREIVKKHIGSQKLKDAFADDNWPRMPKKGKQGAGPVICKVRISIKRKPERMIPVPRWRGENGEIKYAYAEKADNHHLALYQKPNGKYRHDAVSILEAIKRLKRGQPVIDRDPEDRSKFICSLSKGDTLEKTNPDTGEISYWIVKILASSGQIKLCAHRNSDEKPDPKAPKITTLLEHGYKKVSVDPIGRIRKSGD